MSQTIPRETQATTPTATSAPRTFPINDPTQEEHSEQKSIKADITAMFNGEGVFSKEDTKHLQIITQCIYDIFIEIVPHDTFTDIQIEWDCGHNLEKTTYRAYFLGLSNFISLSTLNLIHAKIISSSMKARYYTIPLCVAPNYFNTLKQKHEMALCVGFASFESVSREIAIEQQQQQQQQQLSYRYPLHHHHQNHQPPIPNDSSDNEYKSSTEYNSYQGARDSDHESSMDNGHQQHLCSLNLPRVTKDAFRPPPTSTIQISAPSSNNNNKGTTPRKNKGVFPFPGFFSPKEETPTTPQSFKRPSSNRDEQTNTKKRKLFAAE